MKILFICGCLQPGRDGVGDYTRRLAGELIRQGHECRIIALNDSFAQTVQGADCKLLHDKVEVLRLPREIYWDNRLKDARAWITAFDPDWISLQFVPYSFHPKGLPFFLAERLRHLAPSARWSIMFHELWIGMELRARLRQRFVGALQRQLIRHLVDVLSPTQITTQSTLYISQLKSLGFLARHLPLFGNIPYKHDPGAISNVNLRSLELVLFGGIHQGAPVTEFARECAEYAAEIGTTVHLTIAGRCGPEQIRWKKAWLAVGLEVDVIGECSPDQISRLFQSASFGITTTPLALIEKSGAAAAMLEHSLPVINVAPHWIPRGHSAESPAPGIFSYRPSALREIITLGNSTLIRGTSVESVAFQLSHMLQTSA